MPEDDASLTPEEEAEIVRRALDHGDLPHAAHHVAGLLASDPNRHDHLALFDALAEIADTDFVDLFPMSTGVWFGTAACRARALAHVGQHTEALGLLCRVTAAMPSVPYLTWARAWPLPTDAEVFSTLRSLLEVEKSDTWALALHTVVDRALKAYPNNAELAWFGSIGARRSGVPERGVVLATQSVEIAPSWMGYVALANAERACERWPETEAAWERALVLDPGDSSVLLDWGDTLLERELPDQARVRYAQALQRDPDQGWAEASLRYLDWLDDPTIPRYKELAAWVRTQGDAPRARWALGQATPWLGYLPPPTDATARALDQANDNDGQLRTIAVSHLEGPSVLWAARQAHADAEIEVHTIPDPDPREPLADDLHWSLWTWSGTTPRPTLPPPEGRVAERVSRLARYAFDASNWLGWSTRAAHELGPSAIEALLGATMHPLAAPEGVPSHRWLWRQQHAAAFILAAYPGWEGPHRDALWSMAGVRNDWQAIAALSAAAARADEDPTVAQDVLRMALTVLRSPPDAGAFATAEAAWYVVLRLDPEDSLSLHERAITYLDGP